MSRTKKMKTKRGTTKKIKTKRGTTKKRGGNLSFFKKDNNPVNYTKNTYATMNVDSLHKAYQQNCKSPIGFIKNRSDCQKIDSEFQRKIKEENNKKGNYLDLDDFDNNKDDNEEFEYQYLLGLTLPPNSKSKFKCKDIDLDRIEEVTNLKDVYGDCCPRGFLGKKNTSFCNKVEKKIVDNKYYYPEIKPKKEAEISDDDYEFEKNLAQNPISVYTWTNPGDGITYSGDEAFEKESLYYEKIEEEKEEEKMRLLKQSQKEEEENKQETDIKAYGGKTRKGKTKRKTKRKTIRKSK
jgi:hypothetical protein